MCHVFIWYLFWSRANWSLSILSCNSVKPKVTRRYETINNENNTYVYFRMARIVNKAFKCFQSAYPKYILETIICNFHIIFYFWSTHLTLKHILLNFKHTSIPITIWSIYTPIISWLGHLVYVYNFLFKIWIWKHFFLNRLTTEDSPFSLNLDFSSSTTRFVFHRTVGQEGNVLHFRKFPSYYILVL